MLRRLRFGSRPEESARSSRLAYGVELICCTRHAWRVYDFRPGVSGRPSGMTESPPYHQAMVLLSIEAAIFGRHDRRQYRLVMVKDWEIASSQGMGLVS
jgi:hypothetical protein